MFAEQFPRVARGDKPKAEEQNRLLETVEGLVVRSNDDGIRVGGTFSGLRKREKKSLPHNQNTQIVVFNGDEYAVDCDKFAIVAITSISNDPSLSEASEESFLSEPVVNMIWPATESDQSSWAVLNHKLLAGDKGIAVSSGTTLARVATSVIAGDKVGIDESDDNNIHNILNVVSDGIATVLAISDNEPYSDTDDYAPEFLWAIIRFGGSGGGSGAEIIYFRTTSFCYGMTVGSGCTCIEAEVTRVLCGSSIEVGDTVTIYDPDRCKFNIPSDLLLGRLGRATLFRTGTDLAGAHCAETVDPGTCMWIVDDLCCGEEEYAT